MWPKWAIIFKLRLKVFHTSFFWIFLLVFKLFKNSWRLSLFYIIFYLFLQFSSLKFLFIGRKGFFLRNYRYLLTFLLFIWLFSIRVCFLKILINLCLWAPMRRCSLQPVSINRSSKRSEPVTVNTFTTFWIKLFIFCKILQYLISLDRCISIFIDDYLGLLFNFFFRFWCLLFLYLWNRAWTFSLLFNFKWRNWAWVSAFSKCGQYLST